MTEIYKDVPGYEGIYQVSDQGNVRSLARVDAAGRNLKGKAMKPYTRLDGYITVSLSSKNNKVHRLVMLTFVGPCPEGMNVDHFDENPANNKLCNLSYMTIGDNTYRSRKNMSSQHRGISWHKQTKKWQANIYIDGKQKHLGIFDTEQEAVECRKNFKNN
jgi:hypothetical protein